MRAHPRRTRKQREHRTHRGSSSFDRDTRIGPQERGNVIDVSLRKRLRYFLIGPPRNLEDRSMYHHLSLIAFLAWVGLGADGLSSSAIDSGQSDVSQHIVGVREQIEFR